MIENINFIKKIMVTVKLEGIIILYSNSDYILPLKKEQ